MADHIVGIRTNHFSEILEYVKGLNTVQVPEEVLGAVRERVGVSARHPAVRTALKELGLRLYLDKSDVIQAKINGREFPAIAEETVVELKAMFQRLMEPTGGSSLRGASSATTTSCTSS